MAALLTMQPPVLSCRGECRHFGVNVDQTQNCRYTLGKDGSAGGTCNTHFKVNDKYKVKNYIKHCGKYQENKRNLAVSHGTHDTGQNIIKVGCRNS